MKNSLKNNIKYDLITGIKNRWSIYLLFTVVTIILCASISNEAYRRRLGSISLVEYLIKVFMGMKDFSNADRTAIFSIPYEWFIVQSFFIIMMSGYPKADFNERGYQVLIRSKSKKKWWFSKCVWLLCSTVLYYSILYLIIMVFAYFSAGLSLDTRSDIWKCGVNILNRKNIITAVFIMPAIVSLTLGILEMCIAFLTSTIIAVFCTLSYLVMSAYWSNPILIGNYTMVLRNEAIIGRQGVNSEMGFSLCFVLSVLCIIIGYKHLKKTDIMLITKTHNT